MLAGISSAVLAVTASWAIAGPLVVPVRDLRHGLDDYWGRAHQMVAEPAAAGVQGACPYCQHATGSCPVCRAAQDSYDAKYGACWQIPGDQCNEAIAGELAREFLATLAREGVDATEQLFADVRDAAGDIKVAAQTWGSDRVTTFGDVLRASFAAAAPVTLAVRPQPPEPLDDVADESAESSVIVRPTTDDSASAPQPTAIEPVSSTLQDEVQSDYARLYGCPLDELYSDAVQSSHPAPMAIEPAPAVTRLIVLPEAEPAPIDPALLRGIAAVLDEVAITVSRASIHLQQMAEDSAE